LNYLNKYDEEVVNKINSKEGNMVDIIQNSMTPISNSKINITKRYENKERSVMNIF
jgi:hypothetical protein